MASGLGCQRYCSLKLWAATYGNVRFLSETHKIVSGEVILHAENSGKPLGGPGFALNPAVSSQRSPGPPSWWGGVAAPSKHSTLALGSWPFPRAPIENPGHAVVERRLFGRRRSQKVGSLPLWNGCPFEARMRRTYSHDTVNKSDTLQPTFWPIKTLIISLCSKTQHDCPQIPQAFKSVNHTSINANIVLHGA